MKVLVTGGEGMLAIALKNTLKNSALNAVFCNKMELDITDPDSLLKYFSQNTFDYIINCAAYTNVEGAETNIEQAFRINQTGVRNLAISAKTIGAKLIHISTDAVYDGKKGGVYYESDICNPLSAYSKSKYEGELELSRYYDSGIIIRTSWLYSMDKPNFVSAIINKAKTTGKLNVVFDQLGTPTYTYDLAEAIKSIILSGKINRNAGFDIYHYSNEGAISWYDFAVNICDILKIEARITPVSTDQYPTKVTRPFQSILSKEKIKNNFDLTIPYWRESLNNCLLFYK